MVWSCLSGTFRWEGMGGNGEAGVKRVEAVS